MRMVSIPQHPGSAATVFLDQPPSCLQFCPAAPNNLIIGTYLLSENKDDDGNVQQTKTGSLQSWNLNPPSSELSLIQRLPLPYAVFDLHFHPRDPSILAIATSAASVALFKVSSGLEPTISHLWTLPVHEDPSTPALFLAWAPRNWFSRPEQDGFAVTFSDGRTSVYGTASADKTEAALTEQSNVTQLGTFEASQPIEVWFVALASLVDLSSGPEEPGIPHLFTGDDFGSLHSRQFRAQAAVQSEEEEPLPPLVLDYDDRARHHTAGVTSILPLPLPLRDGAPLLLTGSYDEYVRVYHATRRGQVLAEECLGGGVWRLQLLKTEQMPAEEGEGEGWRFLILASCMHAGTRVVAVTGTPQGADDDSGLEWGIDVLAKFTEHESMNYASDVWKAEGGYDLEGKDISELVCVSSSFYDRRVCVWRVDLQRDRPPISDREVK